HLSQSGGTMPRVVPSDVVQVADQMFPEMIRNPRSFPNVGADTVPSLAALASLVEPVPAELVTVQTHQYAGLVASIAFLEAMGAVFQSKGVPGGVPLQIRGFPENPVALIHIAMLMCPDVAPSPQTTDLPFITDAALRENIRLDISVASQALAETEWKAATV